MKARDLNGQYARWQLLLQEYDFEIVHRAGVKHTNADVLSRFPLQSSTDASGARFDHETAEKVGSIMRGRTPLAPCPLIDSFAPRFGDVFHKGLSHVDQHLYMDGVMRDASNDELDPEAAKKRVKFQEEVKEVVGTFRDRFRSTVDHVVADCKHDQYWDVPPWYEQGFRDHVVDTAIVGPCFFPAVRRRGLVLVELCAGIATGLEALLKQGVRIKKYYYVDNSELARKVAKHKLTNLSAKYSELFPLDAWRRSFDLPQDVTRVTRADVEDLNLDHITPTLVIAGWPCQEYSPAGLGKVGRRAALLDDVTRIIRYLQERAGPPNPPAYILENVAMQHNFRHEHVREIVYKELLGKLGVPIAFDAVQVGSRAHRLRNYWTNLIDGARGHLVFQNLSCPVKTPLNDIMGPGRYPMKVGPTERSHGFFQVNQPGEERRVFPTFTAYPMSRAFKEKRPGSVYDRNTKRWDEPNAEEREACMGYDVGGTAADGATNQERCQLLGQAMDVHSVKALWAASETMCQLNESAPKERLHPAVTYPAPRPAYVNVLKDLTDDGLALPVVANGDDVSQDVWEDAECMNALQTGIMPTDAKVASRIRKRTKWYRWQDGELHRFVKDRRTQKIALRQVPQPSGRSDLIMTLHHELGHIGEKRTIDALSQIYWWHGLTIDVKRHLSTCKLCRRVDVIPPHHVQEMQTESAHDYGMFYRWGLDFLGELPPSAGGNRYAFIAIDYFSKWIEVIPVPVADSETVRRIVQLHLVARYGVPAQIICDNGSPFKGLFEAFCEDRLIDLHFITPGLPRSNGLAERAVKTIKRALQKHAAWSHGAKTWDTDGLANILLGYRCTRQSSSGLSPAQILYAQDPAVRADKWISQRKPMDFMDEEASADELLTRATLASDLRIQVVENLRQAHARNAARFKALRSGTYKPRIHHFDVGDHVFVFLTGEQAPGGALGIPARNEILKVVEIRPTGVLVLQNQAGKLFKRHVEDCSPCTVSNVDGTVHPELAKPTWNFPCTTCGDHRQAAKMLLCDGCNLGFHTYCLPEPLAEVPEGDWLCPTCLQSGITIQQVQERWARYNPEERSRPHIELPSESRRKRARALARVWHGAAVKHATKHFTRVGRMTFTDVSEPQWFKIYWANGSTSLHDTRILARLEKIPEEEAPSELMHRPDPVTILSLRPAGPRWSVNTNADILARLQMFMPGEHSAVDLTLIRDSFTTKARSKLSDGASATYASMLQSVVDLTLCKIVLDPWAASQVVRRGLLLNSNSIICLNDRLGHANAHLNHEPLESHLYEEVLSKFGHIDAVVMSPPVDLADFAFINGIDYAEAVVCMLVPLTWVFAPTPPRGRLLEQLEKEKRLLVVCSTGPEQFAWVCAFSHRGARLWFAGIGADEQVSRVLVRPRQQEDDRVVRPWHVHR